MFLDCFANFLSLSRHVSKCMWDHIQGKAWQTCDADLYPPPVPRRDRRGIINDGKLLTCFLVCFFFF